MWTVINVVFGGFSWEVLLCLSVTCWSTLKFKAQPPSARKSNRWAQTTKQWSAVEEPPNIWLRVAKNALVGWALNFRVRMLFSERHSKTIGSCNSLRKQPSFFAPSPSGVSREGCSCETPLGPGTKKDGCFGRLLMQLSDDRCPIYAQLTFEEINLNCSNTGDMGAFHSTKNSVVNFRKFPAANHS